MKDNEVQVTECVDMSTREKLVAMYRNNQIDRDTALFQTAQALAGDLIVLGIGMKRLSKHLQGLMNGRIYLIGADSGVGKTTIADHMIFSALKEAIQNGIPIQIIYFSWEIARNMKEAKLISWIIYDTYRIRLPVDYILDRMKGKSPSNEHLDMIWWAWEQVQFIWKYVEFIAYECTAAEVRMKHEAVAAQNGHITYSADGRVIGYQKFDPRKIVLYAYDHIALGMQEVGQSPKQMIDAISQTCVFSRNVYGDSHIIIQQFSTDLQTAHRNRGKGIGMFTPQRADFGDSKYTYRDADVVLGILRPADFDLLDFHGYDIDKLERFFLGLFLMKNRYGDAGLMQPIFMDYIPGIPRDLPLPGEEEFLPEEEHLVSFYRLKENIEQCQDLLSPRLA